MKNIVFLCHGNICRSPAAKMIMDKLLFDSKLDREYRTFSYALTREEIGNPIYPPMAKALKKAGIPLTYHQSRLFSKEAYEEAYMVFYMDKENAYLVKYRFEDPKNIIKPISIFTPSIDEIEDPWYTGRYEKVVQELTLCLKDILERL